jgi:hypothetical protein
MKKGEIGNANPHER